MTNWRPTNSLTELSLHADLTRHTGASDILATLKSLRAFAINFEVFHPLAHTDKGRSWRTSKGLLKGDQESQVSYEKTQVAYEGLHGQCLGIHKLKNCSLFKDSSEIAVVKMYLLLGRKRLFALLLDSPSV